MKGTPLMKITSLLIRDLKNAAGIFCLIIFFTAAQTISSILLTFSINSLLNQTIQSFFIYISLSMVLLLLAYLSHYYESIRKEVFIQNTSSYLRLQAIKEANVNILTHEGSNTYSKYTNMTTNDIHVIEKGFSGYFSISQDIISILFSALALNYFHYSIFLVSLGFGLIMIYAPKKFMRNIGSKAAITSSSNENLQKNVNNWLQGLDIIRDFSSFNLLVKKVTTDSNDLATAKINQQKAASIAMLLVSSLNIISQMFILILTGFLAFSNTISFGVIVSVGNLSSQFYSSIQGFNNLKTEILPAVEILKKYSQAELEDPGDNTIPPIESITIENLNYNFSSTSIVYPNMTFQKKHKYIIQGESGSGKSTLINILCGNYKKYSGSICWNSLEYNSLHSSHLKSKIAFVSQRVHLFNASLRDNIIMNSPYDERLFKDVLKKTNLLSVFTQLPEGDKTLYDDNKIAFSGGQLQRISIARALYNRKELIIMDEGTSSLDKENAINIERILLDDPEITLVMVTHHLHDETKNLANKVFSL